MSFLPREKVVIMDNGTGYTKMGFASDPAPAFNIPTLICPMEMPEVRIPTDRIVNEYLHHSIGAEAEAYSMESKQPGIKPMAQGFVENWTLMEKYWHQSIFSYLRCDPAEHVFILTEPPMNPAENRQMSAEIMFETFNVAGLYIGVQAAFSLLSGLGNATDNFSKIQLTGTVLDSGDGVTHIIPVVDGFVIDTCIQHVPLAGSNITAFINAALRARGEKCPPDHYKRVAAHIKEKYCFVSNQGLSKEFENFDARLSNPELRDKYAREVRGINPATKTEYCVTAGPEMFLGPEMFFHPEIVHRDYREPIDQLIDLAVQMSPIMARRALYKNITLSGGSTLFRGLTKRLEK